MKKQIALVLGCLALALSVSIASAAEAPKHAISAKPSMAEKGAFHQVHEKKVKIRQCDECHTKGGLPENTLRLRQKDKLAKRDPGPVDTETCFDCHRRANKPLPYYAKKDQ